MRPASLRAKLLLAIRNDQKKEREMASTSKWLHIHVFDLKTGESKANVKIPTSLAKFGMKMAEKYAPESVEGVEMDEIFAAVKEGSEGKLVDVEDEEKGERVEIYVE
jgi:hypothetical protein